MNALSHHRTTLGIVALSVATVFALAGCSSSSSTTSSDSSSSSTTVKAGTKGTDSLKVSADAALAKKAAKVVPSGTLQVATDASTPPYEFYEDGTQNLRGADIDMANVIAAKLGLKIKINPIQFTGILPAIEAKRYDFAISAMGDTPAREEVVDFVDYSTDSNAIVVPQGNPKKIKDLDSLCGLKVSALEGSVFLGLLQEQDATCSDKMTISIFQDINSALLQVRTGRADATMYQTGVALYLIKTTADAKDLQVITGKVYGEGYNAMPFAKSNSALRDAVQKALVSLKADGTYDKVLKLWNLEPNAIDKITVNDGLKYNQPSN
ncbi:ABC transporter substrate-binding protein [soil metagenome]